MVDEVRRAAASQPGTTLLGDSTIVPLVALGAEVAITGDWVDTNVQRFRSGHAREEQLVELMDRAPAALLLFSSGSSLRALPGIEARLRRYKERARFQGRAGDRYTLFQRLPAEARR
jgi:hypothetical protein